MSPWEKTIIDTLGFSSEAPLWVLAMAAFVWIIFGIFVPAAHFFSYVERKTIADLQARVGPNRSGLGGLFQPLADFMKQIQKRTLLERAWSTDFWLCVLTMALCSSVSFLPIGSGLLMVDVDISLFLPIMTILFLCLSMIYFGIDRGGFQDLLAGIRFFAQGISGVFAVMIILLSAGIRAGGFSWSIVNGSQGASPHSWAAFSDPFQLVGSVLFLVSGQIIFSSPPFDAAYAEGFPSALGHRQVLVNFLRAYARFFLAVVAAVVFFGGWSIPIEISGAGSQAYLSAGTVLFKSFFLMLFTSWVSSVTPRIRTNMTTDFVWRVISPLALLCLFGSALLSLKGWGA